MKTTSFFVPLVAAAYVSAHGFLSTITINGKTFNGDKPSGSNDPSVIRQVSSPSPNKGASNVALTCGPDSTAGSLVADANPGDTLTFNWRGADGSKWPHNTGPMLTYLANCGSTTCDQFDSSKARWFKIDQVGRKDDGSGDWAQQDLMNGGVATVNLPKNLAPGNYLARHEIIALHLATSLGGAEFYPACAQLNVSGSQTGKPNNNELVSIPGAYSDNDPGIFDPSVFDPKAPYTFPGPQIASFISGTPTTGGSGGSGSGGSGGSGNGTTTGSGKPATSSGASGKSCKLKRRQAATNSATDIVVRPRHLSRIMRRMGFAQSLH